MNLKMKTLAVAMLAVGTMASAQAGEALFPYIVNSTTVTTVVSIINANGANTGPGAVLHYRLWYKDGANAEVNSANCLETNVMRSTSFLDIQTIDMGGKFGAATKGVLFNDPSVNNQWQQTGQNFALASYAAKPMRGWLLVEDELIVGPGAGTPSGAGGVQGEAMVFEFASGAAWGYQAGVSDPTSGFTVVDGFQPNVAFGNGSAFVNFAPFTETETKFFVTPITTAATGGMIGASGNNNDNPPNTIQDGYRLSLGTNAFAIVDRDENIISGAVPQDATCVGSINAKTLISGATLAQVPNGGWGILNGAVRGAGVAGKDIADAAVIKLDYNTKATFNGEATAGVYNNAFILKGL